MVTALADSQINFQLTYPARQFHPFLITGHILEEISIIGRLLGRLESYQQSRPQPQLRKSNRIWTVQGSLSIEGNTLSMDQFTGLIDGKPVIGKPSEVQEVLNAIEVYEKMSELNQIGAQNWMLPQT